MAASLRATSTTSAVLHGLIGETVANEEGTSPTYIAGIVSFSVLFLCGFILTYCQIKGRKASGSLHEKDVTECCAEGSAPSTSVPDPRKTSASSDVGEDFKLVLSKPGQIALSGTSREPQPCLSKSPSLETIELGEPKPCWSKSSSLLITGRTETWARLPSKVAPARPPTIGSATDSAQHITLDHVRPSTAPASMSCSTTQWHEDGIGLGDWVGSADWATARASRKKLVQGSSPAQPPRRKTLPLPPAPPATLEMTQSDPNGLERPASRASARVDEQLRTTATEDMSLRKKTFKTLCAKWHPDKNPSGSSDMATEVFQYLQEQKAWYLVEHGSAKVEPSLCGCQVFY